MEKRFDDVEKVEEKGLGEMLTENKGKKYVDVDEMFLHQLILEPLFIVRCFNCHGAAKYWLIILVYLFLSFIFLGPSLSCGDKTREKLWHQQLLNPIFSP